MLTDAPTDAFEEINVTITQVYLLGDEERVLVLDKGPEGITRNLLALRDSAELLLDPEVVEAGCYDKIRLVVSRVTVVPVGGEPVEAKLPANGKIDLNPRGQFCVVPGETLVLQLDLDANNSIHVVERRGGTEFNFRPVVFVTVLDGSSELPGRLVRLRGRVAEVGADRLTLCDTAVEPLARTAPGEPVCTEVVLVEGTSLFDLDGAPFELAPDRPLETAVFVDDFVRVVGRYTLLTSSGEMDEMDRRLRRFRAEVVEVGVSPQTWGRYAGEITAVGPLDENCDGVIEFLLDEGQGISRELGIAVHLYAQSRLFDRNGGDLVCADLQVGARAMVDAVLSRSDGSRDVLNAAVVVTRIEPETQLDGTLVKVGEDGRTLGILPAGAAEGDTVCAVLAPRVIPVLHTPAAGDVPAVFEEVTLGEEHLGLAISVFGRWPDGEECFSAGAALLTAPPPASGT